jgi:hypothetical protein
MTLYFRVTESRINHYGGNSFRVETRQFQAVDELFEVEQFFCFRDRLITFHYGAPFGAEEGTLQRNPRYQPPGNARLT